MLKAFTGLEALDGRSSFQTSWLVRIVSNAAIDLGSKRGRRSAVDGRLIKRSGGWRPRGGQTESQRPGRSTKEDPARNLHREDLRRAIRHRAREAQPEAWCHLRPIRRGRAQL